MRHKTVLKKRLVQVRVEGEAAPGTPVNAPMTAGGKPVGTLFSQSGGQGLAHLRLDRAEGVLEAGAARVIYDG
jgi:folate-binding Fe-S cluster repair protein YgfZ